MGVWHVEVHFPPSSVGELMLALELVTLLAIWLPWSLWMRRVKGAREGKCIYVYCAYSMYLSLSPPPSVGNGDTANEEVSERANIYLCGRHPGFN